MRLAETEFMHIVIDGLGSPYASDIGKVRHFIDLIISELGMTPMAAPIARLLPIREGHDDSGITAIQPIMESHLSIHTFPEADGMVLIDLFSCKRFDHRALIRIANEFWGFQRCVIHNVPRQEIVNMWLQAQVAF